MSRSQNPSSLVPNVPCSRRVWCWSPPQGHTFRAEFILTVDRPDLTGVGRPTSHGLSSLFCRLDYELLHQQGFEIATVRQRKYHRKLRASGVRRGAKRRWMLAASGCPQQGSAEASTRFRPRHNARQLASVSLVLGRLLDCRRIDPPTPARPTRSGTPAEEPASAHPRNRIERLTDDSRQALRAITTVGDD